MNVFHDTSGTLSRQKTVVTCFFNCRPKTSAKWRGASLSRDLPVCFGISTIEVAGANLTHILLGVSCHINPNSYCGNFKSLASALNLR